jgi:hypothetical protein
MPAANSSSASLYAARLADVTPVVVGGVMQQGCKRDPHPCRKPTLHGRQGAVGSAADKDDHDVHRWGQLRSFLWLFGKHVRHA